MNSKILLYTNEVNKLLRKEFVLPVCCEMDLSNYCQSKCEFCISGERG